MDSSHGNASPTWYKPSTWSHAAKLRAVKLVHTLVWAVLAGMIVAIPVCTVLGATRAAWWLIAIVFVEVLVLLVNRMTCPLTLVAARYTDDRRDDFDIYLPLWLARNNKRVFGALYVFGVLHAAAVWQWGIGALPPP